MLAALRRAGSVLPKHARSRQRELQSRRRCLPAEPGGAAPTLVQVGRVVQAEPARHPHDQTDGPEGADMTRGQSLAVTAAASTRQTWLQQHHSVESSRGVEVHTVLICKNLLVQGKVTGRCIVLYNFAGCPKVYLNSFHCKVSSKLRNSDATHFGSYC